MLDDLLFCSIAESKSMSFLIQVRVATSPNSQIRKNHISIFAFVGKQGEKNSFELFITSISNSHSCLC